MTANPDGAWVAQQARGPAGARRAGTTSPVVAPDRDGRFCRAFDDSFRSDGAEVVLTVVLTPVQAPNANAFAERFVGTVRAECWTGC